MLIGLSGYARSGKDTTYLFIKGLRDEMGEDTHHLAFAHALKKSATAALGIRGRDPIAFCNSLKEFGRIKITLNTTKPEGEATTWEVSGREFLQNYGIEAHRKIFGTNFWVDAILPLDFDHSEGLWVVTDVRFQNEAERIRELNGSVWQIDRPGVQAANNHTSELPLDDALVDRVIDNSGTLDDLQETMEQLFRPQLLLFGQVH